MVNTVLQINYSCLNNVSFNGSKYVILYENGIICKTFIFQPANFLYSITPEAFLHGFLFLKFVGKTIFNFYIDPSMYLRTFKNQFALPQEQ